MAKKRNLEEDQKFVEEFTQSQYQNNHQNLSSAKIEFKCKNENQKKFSNLIDEKEMILCTGSAGTGKTFIACAKALQLVKKDKRYKKIVLVKSVTTLEDEEIGFLKGTMEEKLYPFMVSFFSNFEKLIPKNLLRSLREQGIIEVMPVAYCRGINFDNSIVIIDECQNLTKDHIKTLMTRIGYDSKMIFMGDTEQIDRKKKDESSLKWMIEKFKELDEIGTFEFSLDDVVRNPIIQKILEIYNR